MFRYWLVLPSSYVPPFHQHILEARHHHQLKRLEIGCFISLLVTYRLSSCIKDAILLSGRRYIGPSSASSCSLSCMVWSLAVRLQHKFVKINTLFQQQLWLFTKENAFHGTLFFNNSIRCSTFPGLKASCGDKKYSTGPLLCPFF